MPRFVKKRSGGKEGPSHGGVTCCPRDISSGRKQSKHDEIAVSVEGFHVDHAASRVHRAVKSLSQRLIPLTCCTVCSSSLYTRNDISQLTLNGGEKSYKMS